MTSETRFRIDLPTLFTAVNRRRQEQGLPAVEPAVMAVRASIKFAIRQRKHIDLKGEELDIPEADARQLCDTLGELFNVRIDMAQPQGNARLADQLPNPAGLDVSASANARATRSGAMGEVFRLSLVAFYSEFNKARRAKGLMPVEPAVISVRTGVKFAIMRHRTIELQATHALLDADDLKALEQILVQQFDVSIPGGLRSLCDVEKPRGKAGKRDVVDNIRKEPHGVGRFVKQIVGRRERTRRYSLDTNSLLLAILKRRSSMGHKPIAPELIRKKCADKLRIELQLETDLRDPDLQFSTEELDAFAAIIRREFQIIFDDLNDLMEEPAESNSNRTTKAKRKS